MQRSWKVLTQQRWLFSSVLAKLGFGDSSIETTATATLIVAFTASATVSTAFITTFSKPQAIWEASTSATFSSAFFIIIWAVWAVWVVWAVALLLTLDWGHEAYLAAGALDRTGSVRKLDVLIYNAELACEVDVSRLHGFTVAILVTSETLREGEELGLASAVSNIVVKDWDFEVGHWVDECPVETGISQREHALDISVILPENTLGQDAVRGAGPVVGALSIRAWKHWSVLGFASLTFLSESDITQKRCGNQNCTCKLHDC